MIRPTRNHPKHHRTAVSCAALAIVGMLASTPIIAAETKSANEKTILFIAGRDSHGFGSHEPAGGCRVLAPANEQGISGVKTTIVTGGWPKDSKLVEQADAIVLYMDGGGGHPVNRHLDEMAKVMKKGIGLACIHYAVEVPKGKSGDHYLDWIGGYFETHWSVNPHWNAKFTKLPKHEITRGVEPFTIRDEWYYHMRFREGMKNVTPILTAIPPDSTRKRRHGSHSGNPHVAARLGMPEHVAWAATRENGGRGFGFTGGHIHWNWGDENFRRLVLNAIAWVAKIDVPEGGIQSRPIDRGQLVSATGKRGKAPPRKVVQTSAKSGGTANANAPKFKSKIITKKTKGRAVDIDIDIKGAKELYLVVTDGGNGFGCDWANWGEARLVGPRGEVKVSTLRRTISESGFGGVSVNKNCLGQTMKIDGKEISHGLGTHAPSMIAFKVPEGYERFRAKAGLDDGGARQGACGDSASVEFVVYTKKPVIQRVRQAAVAGGKSDERAPENAIAGLDIHEDVEATLFAAEPELLSPTNLDIDERGRVWVCEVVNYRRHNGKRKEGDRILIFEDTNGDGKSDVRKVYYQGRDVDSAMGICVLGNKVIVSATPNIIIFYDDDGDDLPDRKEIMYSKSGQPQHDHSLHSFIFGPDGKLYWNTGNTGRQIADKNGKVIVDVTGTEVRDNGRPYFGGMVFRSNEDGSEFEVLGHNFRNNYETTVDSFGTIWQSDNDDDGNRGVRINFVMEFGNYGYREEGTGRGWRSPRTGIKWPIPRDETPYRHWHLRDPGVITDFVQTFGGSPTGITFYEGDLLPEAFHNEVIHCDAGPNVVRAYPKKDDGAGYKGEMLNILKGDKDRWFRPADVCVAPDGSLFVTDWYDPGVGGHNMRDLGRGRIFRVAPPGAKYVVPKIDVDSIDGSVEAMKNPNLAIRYLAWKFLHKQGAKAETALGKLWTSKSPVYRARALWLLGKIDGRGEHYVNLAIRDAERDIRITGLRLARQLKLDLIPLLRTLVNDKSPQVRRECAVSLRFLDSADAHEIWAHLASQHDGKDRWYVEALGIAAYQKWDACLAAWQKLVGSKANSAAGRDIIWRSRAGDTPLLLADIIASAKEDDDVLRYFRSFDFQPSSKKQAALVKLAFGKVSGSEEHVGVIRQESLKRLQGFDPNKSEEHAKSFDAAVAGMGETAEFVDLVARFSFKRRYGDLVKIAATKPAGQVGVTAIRALLSKGGQDDIAKAIAGKDAVVAAGVVEALGNSQDGNATRFVDPLIADESKALAVRRAAASALAKTENGARKLIQLAQKDELGEDLRSAAAVALHRSSAKDVRDQAAKLFPLPAAKDNKPLPPIAQLVGMKGDAKRGLEIFKTTGTCSTCHIVGKDGKEVGPNLTEIGSKLTREAFFDSILFPSAGISHNFETTLIVLKTGTTSQGIVTSQTAKEVTLRGADAIDRKFKKSDIASMSKQPTSLMPADLQTKMTAQDLADVVSYLTTLKK